MDRSVKPSYLTGQVVAPPSKSMTQRGIAAAMLAEGQSTILNPSFCDDSLAAINIARNLGASVETSATRISINGTVGIKENVLNCGESGLAIRMFSPIAALFEDEIIMTGSGSLKKRPMNMIGDALNQLGASCTSTGGLLPLTIRGPLKGGSCEIDGSLSSQLLTGLLMSLPLALNDSFIKVFNLKSKPYIDMTISVLNEFGIKIRNENYDLFRVKGQQRYYAANFEVEGDWSAGAFLLVAGAINGNIKITGLHTESYQSDMAILNALQQSGVQVNIKGKEIEVSKSPLRSFVFDATESPDLFPPLVALASFCTGTSEIKGTSRLRHKESDRASALSEEFGKMSINISMNNDSMFVTGGKLSGAEVNSHGDHRIAMAAAVSALGASGPVRIKDAGCISKSYPDFFDDLSHLGAEIY